MQYIINIIKDNNEVINKLSKPKIQNDAFLNLNKLYPLNRSNSFGSNKQSDYDNSPKHRIGLNIPQQSRN